MGPPGSRTWAAPPCDPARPRGHGPQASSAPARPEPGPEPGPAGAHRLARGAAGKRGGVGGAQRGGGGRGTRRDGVGSPGGEGSAGIRRPGWDAFPGGGLRGTVPVSLCAHTVETGCDRRALLLVTCSVPLCTPVPWFSGGWRRGCGTRAQGRALHCVPSALSSATFPRSAPGLTPRKPTRIC